MICAEKLRNEGLCSSTHVVIKNRQRLDCKLNTKNATEVFDWS